MGFWTNYNKKVPRVGEKSTTPNVHGYVLPSNSTMGDFYHAIRSLMEASGNFVHVESHYAEGGRHINYTLIMGYGSSLPAPQQFMILMDEDYADDWGYTFNQDLGSTLRETLCIAGRDTDHTPSPTSFKWLSDTGDSWQGFFPNVDDTGGTGSARYWSSYNSTQEMRIYFWSNTDWCVFLIYSVDAHRWHDGNNIFFRFDEPADGHYTRASDGATHGVARLDYHDGFVYTRLAGVAGGYTSGSQIYGTLSRLHTESHIFPPTSDNKMILQKLHMGHSVNISCYLGTLDGFYIGRYGGNLHMLDTLQIDGKEYICIRRGYGGEWFNIFVQNEA